MSVALHPTDKRDGRVFTPSVVADALCRWAIRAPTDTVLDLGVGEGVFLLAAARGLRAVGATASQAAQAIHGAEIDPAVYARAQAMAREHLGEPLPHVVCADFYETPLPAASAVVGNPPYIRRHYQPSPETHRVAAGAPTAHGLTDAYCYFLLRACGALVPSGRMAVIVSGSWLDMRYGEALKRLLLGDEFCIRLVLGFEGRVFSRALVKPVVLLAERVADSAPVSFGRVGQGFELSKLASVIDELAVGRSVPGITLTRVPREELRNTMAWSLFLKAPGPYATLLAACSWLPLRELADSRIGLQTFAKPFYLMTREEAIRRGIESEYLLPLAFSPRSVRGPVLADATATPHVVFACDRPLPELRGTGAAKHIARGMRARVRVRGSDRMVRGYHQAPRLLRAGRDPWYDLRTEIARRGAWPILLPRRAFASFMVIHNAAGAVANEDFLELRPRDAQLTEALLAVLNTSIGEFLVRSHGFQYGGGVFNLNPGTVRELPVPDLARLDSASRAALAQAWSAFAANGGGATARARLDRTVGDLLGVPESVRAQVSGALAGLVQSTREAVLPHGVGQLKLAAIA